MSKRVCSIALAVAMGSMAFGADKKKSKDKDKSRPPTVRAYHKDVLQAGGERQHAITVSVRGDGGVSGTVYAIYKVKAAGGVYTCQTETIGIGKDEKGKKKTKNKNKKNGDKKEKVAKATKTFTFPHTLENATYVDFVVEIPGGKRGVRTYGSGVWARALENLKGNAGGTFNSSGKSVEAKDKGDAESADPDARASAIRMAKFREIQRRNRQTLKDVNKK